MKTAVLVDFNPRTRLIVDVPEGQDIDQYLADDENWAEIAKRARKVVLCDAENYLTGENMFVEEDEECPYGTFDGEE